MSDKPPASPLGAPEPATPMRYKCIHDGERWREEPCRFGCNDAVPEPAGTVSIALCKCGHCHDTAMQDGVLSIFHRCRADPICGCNEYRPVDPPVVVPIRVPEGAASAPPPVADAGEERSYEWRVALARTLDVMPDGCWLVSDKRYDVMRAAESELAAARLARATAERAASRLRHAIHDMLSAAENVRQEYPPYEDAIAALAAAVPLPEERPTPNSGAISTTLRVPQERPNG